MHLTCFRFSCPSGSLILISFRVKLVKNVGLTDAVAYVWKILQFLVCLGSKLLFSTIIIVSGFLKGSRISVIVKYKKCNKCLI
jgi:hypothetical protein